MSQAILMYWSEQLLPSHSEIEAVCIKNTLVYNISNCWYITNFNHMNSVNNIYLIKAAI